MQRPEGVRKQFEWRAGLTQKFRMHAPRALHVIVTGGLLRLGSANVQSFNETMYQPGEEELLTLRQIYCVAILAYSFSEMRLAAQSVLAPLSFEVAAIKASKFDSTQRAQFLSGGRIEMRGATAKAVIESAYSVSEDRIVGAPAWTNLARFDIIAKAASPTYTPSDLPRMLQSLLIERFKLITHSGEKVLPVLALVAEPNKLRLQASASTGKPQCRVVDGPRDQFHQLCQNMTMSDLAHYLSSVGGYIDRPVVDKTELSGVFDIQLDFTRYFDYQNAKADSAPVTSLFDALSKLGLRLDQRRATMDTVVIESIERPVLDQ
jgi:uncharacterized protein (TIGR03435 family)